MGAIASIFVQENLNTPEVIYEFIYSQVRASSEPAEHFCTLRTGHPSIEEMMIIKQDIGNIAELRLECSMMSVIKSWCKGTKKELKKAEIETLDIRRLCLFCVYWLCRERNYTQEDFVREFMAYKFG